MANWLTTLKKFENYTSKNSLETTLNKAGEDLNNKIKNLATSTTTKESSTKYSPSINYVGSGSLKSSIKKDFNVNTTTSALNSGFTFDAKTTELKLPTISLNLENFISGSFQYSVLDTSNINILNSNLSSLDLGNYSKENSFSNSSILDNTTSFNVPLITIRNPGEKIGQVMTTVGKGIAEVSKKAFTATKNFITETVPNFVGKIIAATDFDAVYKSNMVSYEHLLTDLDNRANPTNKNQDWGDFFKEFFSEDTVKEIGSTVLETLKDAALNYAKDFLDIGFKKKSSDGYLYPGITYGDLIFTINYPSYFAEYGYSNNFDKINFIEDIIGYLQPYYIQAGKEHKQLDSWVSGYTYIRNYGGYWDQLEIAITQKLGFNTTHNIEDNKGKYTSILKKVEDQSELFKKWISQNPLLGQHQFDFFISSPLSFIEAGDNIDQDNNQYYFDGSDIGNEGLHFRIKDLSIPQIDRSTTSINYGNSLLEVFPNLQPKSKNIMTFTVIIDRNLSLLEYLINISGLGIKEEGTTDGPYYRSYNLSTVVNHNNMDIKDVPCAILKILNGGDLTKELNFEDNSLNFDKNPPTSKNLGVNYKLDNLTYPMSKNNTTDTTTDTIIYADLPIFMFENFRIINLDYNFKFESNNSTSLLEVKVTGSWSKLYLE